MTEVTPADVYALVARQMWVQFALVVVVAILAVLVLALSRSVGRMLGVLRQMVDQAARHGSVTDSQKARIETMLGKNEQQLTLIHEELPKAVEKVTEKAVEKTAERLAERTAEKVAEVVGAMPPGGSAGDSGRIRVVPGPGPGSGSIPMGKPVPEE